MTWHSNEAAARQVRRYINNYARAQLAEPGHCYLGSLVGFCGMDVEEFAHWAETGEVSDRCIRVMFHGWRVDFPGDDVVLVDADREQERVRVPRRADWRETMVGQVRRSWPGAADRVQAYIETQVTR